MDLTKRTLVLALVVASAVLALAGCSTDENPVSPSKMEEIRKQEGDQRANFNPSTNTTPGGTAPGSK